MPVPFYKNPCSKQVGVFCSLLFLRQIHL
jgi:hypothetical protein